MKNLLKLLAKDVLSAIASEDTKIHKKTWVSNVVWT